MLGFVEQGSRRRNCVANNFGQLDRAPTKFKFAARDA